MTFLDGPGPPRPVHNADAGIKVIGDLFQEGILRSSLQLQQQFDLPTEHYLQICHFINTHTFPLLIIPEHFFLLLYITCSTSLYNIQCKGNLTMKTAATQSLLATD